MWNVYYISSKPESSTGTTYLTKTDFWKYTVVNKKVALIFVESFNLKYQFGDRLYWMCHLLVEG